MTADRAARLPRHVAWLGCGGLLPFAGLAMLSALDAGHAPVWSQALTAYGAVILAFVGALHWGVAMSAPALEPAARRRAYAWSVVPALLAWPAILLGAPVGSGLLMLGFVLHLARDHGLADRAGLPAWYLPLRWRLTVVACACLLFDGARSWIHG